MSSTEPSCAHATSLILASASPRRRALLQRLGVSFDVMPVDVEEALRSGESPWQYARRTAEQKLTAARLARPANIVLASDTVVDLDGVALGKPSSPEEARRMLESLRGRTHRVHTAVAVGAPGVLRVAVCTSEVTMRAYSDQEAERYIRSGRAYDKAGAYAIQDREFAPVAGISGSYSNVVGLPLSATARLLLGVRLRVGTEQDRGGEVLEGTVDGVRPELQ